MSDKTIRSEDILSPFQHVLTRNGVVFSWAVISGFGFYKGYRVGFDQFDYYVLAYIGSLVGITTVIILLSEATHYTMTKPGTSKFYQFARAYFRGMLAPLALPMGLIHLGGIVFNAYLIFCRPFLVIYWFWDSMTPLDWFGGFVFWVIAGMLAKDTSDLSSYYKLRKKELLDELLDKYQTKTD